MLIKVETESLLVELAGELIEKIIGKDLVDEGKKYLGATKCHVRIVKLSKLEFEAKKNDFSNWQVLQCQKVYALNLKKDSIQNLKIVTIPG